MRKICFSLLVVLLLTIIVLTVPVSAGSGSCGPNLTWTFDESTGVLTVSGQGEMTGSANNYWQKYLSDKITKVVIQEGCTSVQGFNDLPKLRSVTLPNSVTQINDGAFARCSLYEIHFGTGLKSIGSEAFSRCALTSIRIPDSVTHIGEKAFYHCTKLQEVHFGAGFADVRYDIFSECYRLQAFTVSSDSPYYSADQGVLYSKDKTELVLMPIGFQKPYTVLPGTKAIRPYACYYTNLQSVTIPGSVTHIGAYAFAKCYQLTAVNLSEGLQSIGEQAFYNTRITELSIPGTVTTIGPLAFGECSIYTLQLSEGLQSIGARAFRNNSITQLTIPSTVTEIGEYAFSGCNLLTRIDFLCPAPVIQKKAFQSVKATCYYPHNAHWQEILGQYGGTLTWKPSNCVLGHEPELLFSKPPTCKETGLTQGYRCRKCFAILQEQKVVPTIDHPYGPWEVQTAPTEQTAGLSIRTCSVCGTSQEKVLNALSESVDPPITDTPSATDAPEASTGTEETTTPAQAVPTPTEPTDPDVTEPEQEKPGPRWWIVALIAGIVLLGSGITGMILIRGGKTVFKKTFTK